MPQVELTRGEYGLEGGNPPAGLGTLANTRAGAAHPGGFRRRPGRGRAGADGKLPHGAGLPVCWAEADPKCHFEGDLWSIWHNSGTTF